MTDKMPEPLAMLKREHDKSKKMIEEFETSLQSLIESQAVDFDTTLQRVRDIFSSIESELLLHIKKEEEGLFEIIGGVEEDIGGPPPIVMEHYELQEMLHEIDQIIGVLGDAGSRGEERNSLIKKLTVKAGFFKGFLYHHIDMEEEELFPMALETMSEKELSRANGRIKIVEEWLINHSKSE